MDFENLKPAGMEIKVLGTGCSKCTALEKQTQQAVEIMQYNVMTTPALVVDGQVVVKGRVPSTADIKNLLTK